MLPKPICVSRKQSSSARRSTSGATMGNTTHPLSHCAGLIQLGPHARSRISANVWRKGKARRFLLRAEHAALPDAQAASRLRVRPQLRFGKTEWPTVAQVAVGVFRIMQNIIHGRPDMEDRNFGCTQAKRHPRYVYSTDANGCLVHLVRAVNFRWYDIGGTCGEYLVRRNSPTVNITTKCGQLFHVVKHYGKKRRDGAGAMMCELPNPDAVLCGRCQGDAASFRKTKDAYKERQSAKLKLGCMVEGEAQ
jgi:hypothetical protein